jgi:hypothetical protein
MNAKSMINKKSGGCGDVLGAIVPRGRRPKAQQLLAGMKNILISKAPWPTESHYSGLPTVNIANARRA